MQSKAIWLQQLFRKCISTLANRLVADGHWQLNIRVHVGGPDLVVELVNEGEPPRAEVGAASTPATVVVS